MVIKIGVILTMCVLGCVSSAFACTSFALYGHQVFYGMNFDYFSIPLKFLIESKSGINLFHLAFLYDKTVDRPGLKNHFAKTCGMNDKGLFCACQEIEPYLEGTGTLGAHEAHIYDQYASLATHTNVAQVKGAINAGLSVQDIGPSVHNLFADLHGNAMVAETDNKKNIITEMDGNAMVMSNFANHSLEGASWKEATGSGADRYKTAHAYLMENGETFSVDKGFDLLKRAVCSDPACPTQCSMIFLPQHREIFISLHQNNEKRWKVSLDRRTIEPCKGHRKHAQIHVGPEGILASELALLGDSF